MFENKDKCVMCGKSASMMIGAGKKDRRVCIDCLNTMNDNLANMKKTLIPLAKAFEKGILTFKEEYEKQQKEG